MIYITGDIHGNVSKLVHDIERLQLSENDTIILLGDAGLNYFGGFSDDIKKMLLNEIGVTVFCVHGNHEMRPETLPGYHEKMWNGGTVYVEDAAPNIIFAKDGELYDLDGYRAIVVGGAYSVDKFYRIKNGLNWFSDEQPSDEIKTIVEKRLESCNKMVDIVLSHTCPLKYVPTEAFLPSLDQSTVDRSTEEWLDKIENEICYGSWFCGHWHIDKRIDKMHFLMDSFEVLPGLENYPIEIDEKLWDEIKEWSETHGTTTDILIRYIMRFIADPKNKDYLRRFSEKYNNGNE